MKKLFLGNNERITTGIDMPDIFLSLAKKDEQAGNILYQQKLYNQAAYFYIQSMEKYIKSFICKKIDITNEFYAKTIRGIGHSLDSSAVVICLAMTVYAFFEKGPLYGVLGIVLTILIYFFAGKIK